MKLVGLFVLSLLAFSMFAVALSPYSTKVALDEKGVVNIESSQSFFLSQCREDTADKDYALELYGKVLFQTTNLAPTEVLSMCSQPDGVDQIVNMIDRKTRGKDLSAACIELDDAVARCENAKDNCEEIKENRADFLCPPDAAKMIELCKQRFQKPIDNCEEEYSRSKDKIEKYCSGTYWPLEFIPSTEEKRYNEKSKYENQKGEAYAREKCAKYGGAWRNGNCELPDKPISERGECPKVYRENFYCPPGARVVEKMYDNYGKQCVSLSCDYGAPLSELTTSTNCRAPPVCSSDRVATAVNRVGSCPQYSCEPAVCPQPQSCGDGITAVQGGGVQYINGQACHVYTCTGITTSTATNQTQTTCNAPIPACPAGQYAQAQSGQNTACPSNYQCVSSTQTSGANATTTTTASSGSCSSQPVCPSDRVATVVNRVSGCAVYSCEPAVCPSPQTCSDGTTAVQGGGVQYINGQACYVYTCTGTSGSSTSGTSGSTSGTNPTSSSSGGGCNAPIPACPAGQYAQAQSGQNTACPSNYQCVASPSGSSGGSSGPSCPGPQSCSSGSAYTTGRFDSAGCALYECPPVTSSGSQYSNQTQRARSITGLQVGVPSSTTTTSAASGEAVPTSTATEEQSTSVSTAPFEFCTKEGFMKQCRSAVFQLNALEPEKVQQMCEYEVKRNLPFMAQFCSENSANLYGKCKAHTSQACSCLKQKTSSCKTFANREKFLAIVREKVEVECKKYLYRDNSAADAVSDIDYALKDASIEDKVTATQAMKTITLTAGELEKIKADVAEEAKRDALIQIKKLLGMQSGQIEQQIASLKQQRDALVQAVAVLKTTCVSLPEESQSACSSGIQKLEAQVAGIDSQMQALESDKNGFLGAIAKLFSGLGNAPTTASTTPVQPASTG